MRNVLNISEFGVCQVSTYASVAQGSEYAWICLNNALGQYSEDAWSMLHMALNKLPVLNMPGLKIWQGEGYTGCLYEWIRSQYACICLNNA